jgi:hypothetical protein
MKMKHIIALCIVFALVLPSTALASGNQPAKVNIKVVNQGHKTVTVSYTLTGAKELNHTWSFGDGFTCHCKHRTHTYKNHGTYNICITLKTTAGKIIKTCKKVTV